MLSLSDNGEDNTAMYGSFMCGGFQFYLKSVSVYKVRILYGSFMCGGLQLFVQVVQILLPSLTFFI